MRVIIIQNVTKILVISLETKYIGVYCLTLSTILGVIYFCKKKLGSSRRGAAETNPTRNHEVVGSIPGLAQWVKDLALLWLYQRPAATAPIRPLACEPPYALGCGPKKKQKSKKKKKKKLEHIYIRIKRAGVPTVAQWVKNPNVVAQVTEEVQVQVPAWHYHSCNSD